MAEPFDNHKESRMHGTRGSIYDISWSSDGSLLTAAESKGPVRSWRLERGGHKEGEEIRVLGGEIGRLAWCPAAERANILAAATYDKTIHMWDQRANSISATLATNGLNSDICWSPSGKYFASVSRETGLDVFDLANTQTPVVSAEIDEMVCAVSWDMTERLLFLSTHQGNVEVYSWPDMEHLTMIPAHSASCNCIAVDPRGTVLATGGADATLELWSTEDYSIIRAIDGYESPLLFIDFSRNGEFIASASDDLDIKIHDSFSGDLVKKVPVDALTTALEWHPRNLAIAYASTGSSHRGSDPAVCIFAPGPR
ncbi:hypothetical protein GGI12_001323 [Dipsacomyces acuminosporus]|nr:hypothetical protein GGI12_001323 [Dipsacomyces acuminosporus]